MPRSKKKTEEKPEEKHCANHPDVIATEVCACCGKDICYNCQLIRGRKIYCSHACYLKSLRAGFWGGIAKILLTLLRFLTWPFRMLVRLSLRGWLEAALIAAVGILFYFQWHVLQRVKILSQAEQNPAAVIDTTRLDSETPLIPARGGMVTSSRITIQGQAEKNHVITLSIDGQLKKALIPEKKRFEFKDLRLHRGQNRVEVRALNEAGDVALLQSLTFTYAPPTPSWLAADFRRGPLNKKQMAFTFDGGASNNITDAILDILKERHIQCTLFLTGNFMRHYPESVKRMIAEGHEVCNHTWNHPRMTSFEENGRHETLDNITAESVQEQLNKTAALFKMITGQSMTRLWRAPYGYHNREIRSWAAEIGYRHIGWTVGRGWKESMDSLDWVADKESKVYHSADEIAEKILQFGKGKKSGHNGAVVLMHLGSNRIDDFPYQKLPEILDTLAEQGYEMVTISQMLQNQSN